MLNECRHLELEEIVRLSSPYLGEGRKQETWVFESMVVDGNRVSADVAMRSVYVSATDPGGFHLSFITAIEIISQLTVVALHSLAGLETKSREVWVRETRGYFDRPIRERTGLRVEMHVTSLRQRGATQFCDADYRITDASDGLFRYWGKSVLL